MMGISKEEYNKLKDIHKDYLQAHPPETGENAPYEVKNALWEVIHK